MAGISSTLLSLSNVSSPRVPSSPSFPNYASITNRGEIQGVTISIILVSQPWSLNKKRSYGVLRKNIFRFPCAHSESASPIYSWSQIYCIETPTTLPALEYSNGDDGLPIRICENHKKSFNQIDYLTQSVHKSAKSFSIAIQNHELVRNGPELSKAWVGVDLHAWHRHIAYQAAVYALLQTIKELGIVHHAEHGSDPHPLCKILSPKISILHECIEVQLGTRDPRLVEWFKMDQLPVLTRYYTQLLERQSTDGHKSGIAVVVLAISCSIAVQKLGAGRISCPMVTISIPGMIGELMEFLSSLASMHELLNFASEAGFEREFLVHFGSNMLYHNTSPVVIFWVSLVWRKLIVAFQREGLVASLQIFHDNKMLERDLATLGLFAYLGRKTRLFISCMGIKDLDEPLKDFLSYLECGGLFIFPKLSCISMYQLFMEVVSEEIGWLDFYGAVPRMSHTEGRRSKQHAVQAKKEIILSTVVNVCCYVFSCFAHFSKSTQQSLDDNLVAFLVQSQNLLNTCIEDCCVWAADDKLCSSPKITGDTLPACIENQDSVKTSVMHGDIHQKSRDVVIRDMLEYMQMSRTKVVASVEKRTKSGLDEMDSVIPKDEPSAVVESKPAIRSLLRKYSRKLRSTSSDIWMGTGLLFVDISASLGILQKQICGHTLTNRERKKLKRTLADIVSLVPVTILMLLPVSVVGHAAMIAVIKKYIPCLIPSPYSKERLDAMKQLERTKKMGIQS